MKKYKKFIISLLTVSAIISNNCYNAFAATEEQGYLENHVDINLTNINLAVSNNEDLIMSVDKSKNVLKQINGKSNIDKIEKMTERYPEFESDLIEMVNDYNEVAAIGSTEAPLEEIDGQLQRVENESKSLFDLKASAAKRKSSCSSYYYLNLTTIVCRVEYSKSGKSHYICDTEAYWSKNSAVSGKKYPAGGEDYILQSLPKGFTIDYDCCTTMYNDGSQNPSGAYRRMNGGSQYVKYAIKDDPFGTKQLREATVITSSYAKSNTTVKRINSYYVHTWKQMTLDVEVSANTDKQVSLTLKPGTAKKQWQLYNYVSFNF